MISRKPQAGTRRRVGGPFRGRRGTFDPIDPCRQVGERALRANLAAQRRDVAFERDPRVAFGVETLAQVALDVAHVLAGRLHKILEIAAHDGDLVAHRFGAIDMASIWDHDDVTKSRRR